MSPLLQSVCRGGWWDCGQVCQESAGQRAGGQGQGSPLRHGARPGQLQLGGGRHLRRVRLLS